MEFNIEGLSHNAYGVTVPVDKRLERLKFRSWHRGTREMDLLLGSFVNAHLAQLPPDEIDQYEALLQQSDPDLYNWITGSEKIPPEFDHKVMQRLRMHKVTDKS